MMALRGTYHEQVTKILMNLFQNEILVKNEILTMLLPEPFLKRLDGRRYKWSDPHSGPSDLIFHCDLNSCFVFWYWRDGEHSNSWTTSTIFDIVDIKTKNDTFWICSDKTYKLEKCGFSNFLDTTKCNFCLKEWAPDNEITTSWKCAECDHKNQPISEKCEKCAFPKVIIITTNSLNPDSRHDQGNCILKLENGQIISKSRDNTDENLEYDLINHPEEYHAEDWDGHLKKDLYFLMEHLNHFDYKAQEACNHLPLWIKLLDKTFTSTKWEDHLDSMKNISKEKNVEVLEKKTLKCKPKKVVKVKKGSKRKGNMLSNKTKKKRKKVDMWSKKVAAFSKIIQNAGYCVRMPPSLAQIKKYLKKEKNASKSQLNSVTEANVAEKFAFF